MFNITGLHSVSNSKSKGDKLNKEGMLLLNYNVCIPIFLTQGYLLIKKDKEGSKPYDGGMCLYFIINFTNFYRSNSNDSDTEGENPSKKVLVLVL